MSYLEEVKDIVRATEQAKRPHVERWQTNIAYFKGYQYHSYMSDRGLIQKQNKPKWRVELTVNYVRPVALVTAAKMTQNRPNWGVLPATEDQQDRDKARLSQALLDYVWEKEDCQGKLYDMALDSVLTGQGYWGVYWDRYGGDPIRKEDLDPEKQKISTGFTGFPRLDVIKPFDIGLDPLQENIQNCEWGYRLRLVSVEWAKRIYQKTMKADTGRDFDELTHRLAEASILNEVENHGVFDGKYTTIIEWFDTVKRKYMVFAPKEKVILDQGKWPFPVPFVQARAIPNTGDIEPGGIGSHANLGETSISDIIQLQRELNRSESQLIEIKNLLAFPRILAHVQAQVNPMSLIDMPGSVVEWHGSGMPPQPFHLGNIPPWVFQMPDRCIDRIRDISGIHEISYGGTVPSIQSGRGLAILAEQDATKFAPQARSLGRAVRQAGLLILKLWRAYADGPTTLRVVGRNQALEVNTFYREDISSEDVIVQVGSTFGGSKSIQQDQALQMWQLGIEQDPRKMKRVLEFGDVDEIIGDLDVHRLKQRREIAAMIDGAIIEIKPWEDHFIHLDEMTLFLNSTQYDDMDKPIQKALGEHYMAHQISVQQQQQAEAGAAQQRGVAAAGAPRSEMVANVMKQGGELPSLGVDRQAEAFPGATGTVLEGGVKQ